MTTGALISFSGVDSAGKSTQIEALTSLLSRAGVRFKLLWYRPGYSPILDWVRATIRRARPGALPPPGPSHERQTAFSRPSLQRVWVVIALIDTVLHLARIRWLMARGVTVICDRYVDDWVLDLDLHFPSMGTGSSWLGRLVRRFAPRPRTSLLLVLGWDEMTRRATEKNEPFPDPPEIRRKRFDAYRALAADGNLVVIEADQSPEEVHRDVIKAVGAGPWSS